STMFPYPTLFRSLQAHPRITIHREEVTEIPTDAPVVIATGPLTSPALAQAIQEFTGEYDLYFYDAASPIIDADTIDWDKGFWASRYGRGEGDDYFNCPMTKEEYDAQKPLSQSMVSASI